MTVRLALATDGATIAALRRSWVEENAGGPVDDATFEGRFASWWQREQEQRLTWLAEVDGVPIGMLNLLLFDRMPFPLSAVTERATQWGYVANVFVRASDRGAGLGAALLAACTAYADEHGLARLVLSPSERSVPLYERFGFAPAVDLMLRPGRRAEPPPRGNEPGSRSAVG